MADFENLQVSFGKLDTKMDPRAAPPGTLTLAENCQTQIVGVYKKRFGYTALTALSGIVRLAVFGVQLLACSGDTLYNYDPASTNWHSVGTGLCTPVEVSQSPVILDQSNDIERSTTAVANGIRVDAWIDTVNGFVTVEMRNDATGGLIARSVKDSTGLWNYIHSLAVGNKVGVVFSSTGMQKINVVLVDCVTGVAGVSTTILSGADVSGTLAVFDIAPVGTSDVLIAWQTNTPNVKVWRLSGVTLASVAGPSIVAAEDVDTSLSVMATEGETGYILYHSAGAGAMRTACFNPATTAQTVAPVTAEVDAGTFANVNCGLVRQDATHALAVWDRYDPFVSIAYSRWAPVSNAGVVGGAGTFRNHRLASKPFVNGGNFYTTLIYNPQVVVTPLRPVSYVTARISATSTPVVPVALHAFRTAPSLNIPGQLPDISSPSAGIYRFDGSIAYKFLSTSSARIGQACFTVDFTSPRRALPVEANQDVLFAGGVPMKTDGIATAEINFIDYPEIVSAVAGAAGGMDDGQRFYVAIFETSDAAGNTARSTLSNIVSATTTAGAGAGKVTLSLTSLNMTRLGWATDRQQGTLAIFRTTVADPTTFKHLASVPIVPTVANITYVDIAQDSTLATKRFLYTTGGVLEREPPPASLQLALHQGRIWGISASDRKLIFYSGDVSPGEDIWFSSIQQFRVEPGGDITAIASLDDKLVIFKSDRLFKVTGRGGNQAGQNSDLSLPQLISSDCGCIEPRSVVQMPDGIMFLSAKGIYLLNRSEQVVFIGAPVDYWTSHYDTCTSARMVPDRQEIRFTMKDPVAPLVTPAGVTLVYNYSDDSWTHWSILDGTAASDAVVAGPTWYWATAAGASYGEDPTTFLDAGNYQQMTLETAWIQPSGPQGLARVNRAMVLGQSRADHGLELQIAKDYSDAYTMDGVYSTATLSTLSLEQVAHQLEDQKGQSFRVRVNDFQDGLSSGEGFWTTGILLKAKPIRGAFDKLLQSGAKT